MNARNSISRWGLSWVVLCAALVGCGGPLRYSPKGTPRAPEADAFIEAQVNQENAITQLLIKADHLAPPDRLAPGATTYVVWSRKDDSTPWTRVGALKYDPGARKGELNGVSVPMTSFELIVSLEKQGEPAAPSGDVVLTQKVNAQQQ